MVDVQPVGHIVRPLPHVPPVAPPVKHTPSLQIWLGEQPCPQLPQLLTSRRKSAQYVLAAAPKHWFGAIGGHGFACVAPPSRLMPMPASASVVPPVHVPLRQPAPLAQTLPHRPQL